MTKTFADSALKIAEKAQEIAAQKHYGLETGCDAWIELQKLDSQMRDKMVPELARRLKRACFKLEQIEGALRADCRVHPDCIKKLRDELEKPMEGVRRD